MKKALSIIGAIVVFVGAVVGALIYLKKKGIIDFDCVCKHHGADFSLECCDHHDEPAEAEKEAPAEAPAE